MEVLEVEKNNHENQHQNNDESLMNKVNEAFDDMVEDVRKMVHVPEQKEK